MVERIRAVEVELKENKAATINQTAETRLIGSKLDELKNVLISELRLKADKSYVDKLDAEYRDDLKELKTQATKQDKDIFELSFKLGMLLSGAGILTKLMGLW